MIAVVGGGITGLATGLELERLGEDFVVLEASPRAGGVVRSAGVEGRVLDWGPQRVRLTRKVSELVAALRLERELLTAPPDLPLYVFREGRLHAVPFSVGAFLASDALSLGGKVRAALEPLTAGMDPRERVSEYFTRKLGREFYETLAGPLYGGLYASDPADMEVGLSLVHALRDLGVGRSLVLRFLRSGGSVRPPPACSFRGGMEALPAAMGRALGERLRLRCPVRGLRRRSAAWRLETADGPLDAAAVVLTAPAPAAAALLRHEAPAAAAAVGRLRYNPLAIVHLVADIRLRGAGFQVALSEARLSLRGVTFNESLFGRPGLYTAYLGGALHPDVADMDQAELASQAAAEFRACTGADAHAISVERARMPAWDISWRELESVELPPGLRVAASWWSRPGLPGRLADGERVARDLATRRTRGPAPAGARCSS